LDIVCRRFIFRSLVDMGVDELLALSRGRRNIRAPTAAAATPTSTPALGSRFVHGVIPSFALFRILRCDKFDTSGSKCSLRSGLALAFRALFGLLCAALPAILSVRVPYFPRGLVPAAYCSLLQFVGFFLVFHLKEVSDVKEGVSLEPNVNKCRLHAGEHACDAAVVNRPRQGVLVFAFVVNFRELIVF
jgi:hypothetical protein